ncbi:hypothetical protein OIE68_15485 [Nocardia vinacea]|uniref:hypothetical protein n=1 Tax=Nocardia vinacea TaxID=96468 RepID=UPI002E106616|nr:hypothetical protein OIE68_15485 [Nocardia vinacea]
MTRRRDQWATATCRQEPHQEWARQNHGSFWDFCIDGEKTKARQQRHTKAAEYCLSCPLRTQCEQYHQQLSHEAGQTIVGIWAGRLFTDKPNAHSSNIIAA